MKKYFINKGAEKKGPFTLEELKKMELTEDYLVWANGFDDWTKITDVEELKDIIIDTPPLTPMEKEKAKKKGSIIRVISSCVLITTLLWLPIWGLIPKHLFYNDRYPVYGNDKLDTMFIVIAFLVSAIIACFISIKLENWEE